jgi:hypothetical protein
MNAAGDGWLVRSIASLESEYGAVAHAWLHPAERAQYERFHSSERRASWLWGRVVAKRLIGTMAAPWKMEIRSRSEQDLGVAPTVWIDGRQLPLILSIAHAGQFVAAACSSAGEIGIDIIDHAAHRLPQPEQWAIKEAAFKCLPAGTPFQPGLLKVELNANSADWLHTPSLRRGRARLLATDTTLLALAWRSTPFAFSLAP